MGRFTISVVGKDRPGIVAATARVLFELGCNIDDSTSTILSGQFAMILAVGHPTVADAAVVDAAFAPVRDGMKLHVAVHAVTDEEAANGKEASGRPVIISVYGADRPGIVLAVAEALARRKINVTDLNTQVVGAKERPVYVMILEASLPDEADLPAIEAEFETLRKELSVSITVRPLETLEL